MWLQVQYLALQNTQKQVSFFPFPPSWPSTMPHLVSDSLPFLREPSLPATAFSSPSLLLLPRLRSSLEGLDAFLPSSLPRFLPDSCWLLLPFLQHAHRSSPVSQLSWKHNSTSGDATKFAFVPCPASTLR